MFLSFYGEVNITPEECDRYEEVPSRILPDIQSSTSTDGTSEQFDIELKRLAMCRILKLKETYKLT